MSGYCGICSTTGHVSSACTASKKDYSSKLEMHKDKDISPALRKQVKQGMAVNEPGMAKLPQFQEENVPLGRETRNAKGEPTRTQQEGRRWFAKQGVQLSTDTHVDHVVPFSEGGAHVSSNATLLTGKANMSKGAKFSAETVLQAGGVKAGARAIHVSAHEGNKTYGKYEGGVPKPKTWDYPDEALKDNDGKNLKRNEDILRDMVRAQKEGVAKKADGTADERYKHTVPLKADGTADKRYNLHSTRREDTPVSKATPTPTPSVSAAVKYTASGAVDKRCAAYRSGAVKLTKSGNVDGRCKAARAAKAGGRSKK